MLDDNADSDDESGISFIPSNNDEDVEDKLSGFHIEEDDDDDDKEDINDEVE